MKRFTIDVEDGLEAQYLEAMRWGRVAPWFREQLARRIEAVLAAYAEARAHLEPSAIVGEVAVELEGGAHFELPSTGVVAEEFRSTGLTAPQLVGWCKAHFGLSPTGILAEECRATGLTAPQLVGWLEAQEQGRGVNHG
jgi:hypothetical protein